MRGEIGPGLLVLLGIADGRRGGGRRPARRQGRAAARVRGRRGPLRPLAARHRRRRARGQPVHPARRHDEGQSPELHRRGAARATPSRSTSASAPRCASSASPVETGVFGARMEVELVNDGPVTIVLEQWAEARAADRPNGLSLATLPAPFSPAGRNGRAAPIFVEGVTILSAVSATHEKERTLTRADRTGGHDGPAGRRGARGRARRPRSLHRLRRPRERRRPRALRARHGRAARLPERLRDRRLLTGDRAPAAQAGALPERDRPPGDAAHARSASASRARS